MGLFALHLRVQNEAPQNSKLKISKSGVSLVVVQTPEEGEWMETGQQHPTGASCKENGGANDDTWTRDGQAMGHGIG